MHLGNTTECLDNLRRMEVEKVDCGNDLTQLDIRRPSRLLESEDVVEELIAVSFHDRRRAEKAFQLLWQMADELVIKLDDAVIVHRDRHGDLEYDQDFTSTSDRRLIQAGLRGGLLGALVAMPFAAGASLTPALALLIVCFLLAGSIGVAAGALDAAADVARWKEHLCVPKCLVPEVIDKIAPDDSAVVAWVGSDGIETAAPVFRGFGGKVLCTTLPPEEFAKLEAVLKG